MKPLKIMEMNDALLSDLKRLSGGEAKGDKGQVVMNFLNKG